MTAFRAPFDKALADLTPTGSPYEIGTRTLEGRDYLYFVNAPESLVELVDEGRQFGDQEFLVYQDQRWSFDQFYDSADRLANQLRAEFGVKKGDRIAIAMRNYPEWMVSFVAILSLGAVVVPLNSWGQKKELRQNISDANAQLIICDEQRAIAIDPTEIGLAAIVARADQSELPKDCHHFSEVTRNAKSASPISVTISGEDTAMIMFTSGTSGRAKGAIFSHRNCCQSIINFEVNAAASYFCNQATFAAHAAKGLPSKSLLAVPLFHVSGLLSQFLLNLRGGRGIVIMYKWDPAEACRLVTEEQVSVLVGAPSMMMDFLEHEKFQELDPDAILNLGSGGAAVPSKLANLSKEKLPNSMAGAGWGMTETAAAGSSFNGCFFREKPNASGFVSPIVELRFCDEDGATVADGEPGEIWIKSPTVVAGYCNAPEASASEFVDGWFKTGDIGYIDADGCIIICDRAKDMVIRGGENIYPVEIENCIQLLPEVLRVAAFAVPSERFGEELAVVIQPKAGVSLDEQRVLDHCSASLAAFKVPSHIRFSMQDLPVNATNKILKKQVKALFFESP